MKFCTHQGGCKFQHAGHKKFFKDEKKLPEVIDDI